MSSAVSSDSSLAAARVVLKPRRAQPFYGRHPWVLASAVGRVQPLSVAGEHDLDLDGQPVDLVTDKGKFIARGLFNSHSRIRVRLLTWSPQEAIDEAFFRRKLAAAINLRRQLSYEPPLEPARPLYGPAPRADDDNLQTAASASRDVSRSQTATRLVFSEADGLSGLVVDRYGDFLVIQPTSLGMAQRLEMLVGILQEMLRPRAIVLRADKATSQLEGIELADGHVWGEMPEGSLTIREHGIAFEVDLRCGQKTGLYLDQRENHRAAAAYLRGRRVLDMFCYCGGFSLAAIALGGAREVLGIDTSKRAVAQARRNAERNGLSAARFEVGDAFPTLDALIEQGEKFDAVILDPPKFTRGRGRLNAALMAYHRLNRTAVELLTPGGILVTCSCTGSVTREDFLRMLSGVAQKSGRDILILEQRTAAADHPVSTTCLETEYLKCMICSVT